MKILTYLFSLIASGFVYFLFVAYMSVASGFSNGPVISIGFAIFIFGFLSWFHFYKPKIGAWLLTIAVIGMYFSWPIHLGIEYFSESEYNPSPIEFLLPLILGILAIILVWKSKNLKMHKWTKLILAIPPAFLGIYVIGYMGLNMIN
ncbi:MAG: hypothetical protein ABGX00_03400 [Allomuricauda sp.]